MNISYVYTYNKRRTTNKWKYIFAVYHIICIDSIYNCTQAELDPKRIMWFLCFCHTPSLHLRVDDFAIDVFRCLLITWQYACDWLLVLMTRFRLFNPCCIAKLWRFVPLLLGSMCLGPPLTVPDSALRDGRAPAHRQTDTSRIQFQHLAALFVKGLWRCQHWIFCAAALSRLLRCPNTSAGPWALGTGQERLSKDDSWNLSLGTPYFKKSRRWDCLDCLCNQRLADPWDSVEYCFVASAFQAV